MSEEVRATRSEYRFPRGEGEEQAHVCLLCFGLLLPLWTQPNYFFICEIVRMECCRFVHSQYVSGKVAHQWEGAVDRLPLLLQWRVREDIDVIVGLQRQALPKMVIWSVGMVVVTRQNRLISQFVSVLLHNFAYCLRERCDRPSVVCFRKCS